MRFHRSQRARGAIGLVSLLLPGALVACNALFGIETGELAANGAGGGGASSTSESTAASGGGGAATTTGGGGGSVPCTGLGGVDAQAFVRARRFGGAYDDRGRGVAFTDSGGVVLTGTYSEAGVIFGSTPLPYPEPDAGLAEGSDIFVAQFREDGLFDWALGYGGAGDQSVEAFTRDGAGHLVIAGMLYGSLKLGNDTLDADASRRVDAPDGYVARLDAFGGVLWSRRFGGAENDFVAAVATAADGSVVVAGPTYAGDDPAGVDADFGDGPVHLEPGFQGVFLTQLDASGNTLWSHVFPVHTGYTTYWDDRSHMSLAFDPQGNILFAGTADGPTNSFGQGPLEAHGDFDVFLYKCDASGNYLYATTYGDENAQFSPLVAGDACGNVYLAGGFTRSAVFPPLAPISVAAPGSDPEAVQIFVARLDANPNPAAPPVPVWSKAFGDDGFHHPYTLRVDDASNVLVGGSLVDGPQSQGVDFGDGVAHKGPGLSEYLDYRPDLFLVKLRGDGTLRWAKRQGSVEVDDLFAVAVTDQGRLAATGAFDGAVDFGSGTLTPANLDVFLLELGP